MGCGVRGPEEVKRYFDIGADAVSFCTLALRHPGEAADLICPLTGDECWVISNG